MYHVFSSQAQMRRKVETANGVGFAFDGSEILGGYSSFRTKRPIPIGIIFLMLGGLCMGDGTRSVINRINYGVLFEPVGQVLNSVRTTSYTHSLTIAIPTPSFPKYPPISCRNVVSDNNHICLHVNELITKANMELTKAENRYALEIDNIVGQLRKTVQYEREKNYDDRDDHDAVKRSMPSNNSNKKSTWENDNYRTRRSIFGWFKASFSKVRHSIGNAFAHIFHVPGPDDLSNLKQHMSYTQQQVNVQTQRIEEFNKGFSRVYTNIFNSTNIIKNQIEDSILKLQECQRFMNRTFHVLDDELATLRNLMGYYGDAASELFLRVHPALAVAHSLDTFLPIERWIKGMYHLLSSGLLTENLVPIDTISEIHDGIVNDLFKRNEFIDYTVVTNNLQYYYQLKNTIFHYNEEHNSVTVMLTVPLQGQDGLLNLYKIHSHSIPMGSGFNIPKNMQDQLKNEKGKDTNFINITDLPQYLAISQDSQHFIELSEKMLLSCRGETIKICSGLQSLRKLTYPTCAISIFYNNLLHIKSYCNIQYTEDLGPSEAYVLPDNNVLIRSPYSNNHSKWKLSCFSKTAQSFQTPPTCDFCIIDIKCGCSLSGDRFFLANRLTNCNDLLFHTDTTILNIDYYYITNIITLSDYYPQDEILKIISGNTLKADHPQNYHHIPIPPFNHSDAFRSMDSLNRIDIDYKKYVVDWSNDREIFKSQSHKLLKQANDLSDVVIQRDADLAKAARDVLGFLPALFNIDLRGPIAVITSFTFLSFLGVCILLFILGPDLIRDFFALYKWVSKKCHKNIKGDKYSYTKLYNLYD